jgi:hypothetical protein
MIYVPPEEEVTKRANLIYREIAELKAQPVDRPGLAIIVLVRRLAKLELMAERSGF